LLKIIDKRVICRNSLWSTSWFADVIVICWLLWLVHGKGIRTVVRSYRYLSEICGKLTHNICIVRFAQFHIIS